MIKKCILLLLLFLLSALPAGECSQADYLITEEQLTKLEQNLNQLELNSNLQNESSTKVEQLLTDSNKQIASLSTKLAKVEELLIRSDKQIAILQEKLAKAENSVNLTQNDLQNANEYLNKYEKEVKQEIRKLTWQRNIALAGIAYMVAKK